ncbi:hypothetical protein EG68_10395 [Paragonimus skrjabini miyazakii]|uniref:V-SNARE coiled-coil homology domain-containing protein n=1 Tax=Paragonimus skrjabini miyazakii TaxID=59628 RepID=A0A8S9YL63_9TREM|nr:hypothetical protein EG68_10395 [Paragonimus skrjabini miyazakii]
MELSGREEAVTSVNSCDPVNLKKLQESVLQAQQIMIQNCMELHKCDPKLKVLLERWETMEKNAKQFRVYENVTRFSWKRRAKWMVGIASGMVVVLSVILLCVFL